MALDYRVLIIYLAGVFMGALDINILGPVLPGVTQTFGVPFSLSGWVLTAFSVPYVAATALAGPLGDRHGRKKIFAAGVLAFAVASLLAALSNSFGMFLFSRAIQGVGAGAVNPNARAEGVRPFPPERRGTALGIFGAIYGLASIAGPTLGGALGEYWGWRSIFLLHAPVLLILFALTFRLPEAPRSDRAVPDWLGGISFAALLAVGLLVFTSTSTWRIPLLAGVVVFAAVFFARQRRANHPFLNAAPLASFSGVALIIGAVLAGFGMSAATFVPALAQEKLSLSVFQSGLGVLPAAISGAILAGMAGVLVDRVGPRRILQIGFVAAAAGGVVLALPQLTLGLFIGAMVLLGLSSAFTVGAPLNRLGLSHYDDEEAGQALSLVAVFRSVGLAIGPVVLTFLYRSRGFSGMFAGVVVAALLAVVFFGLVPENRPAKAGDSGRA